MPLILVVCKLIFKFDSVGISSKTWIMKLLHSRENTKNYRTVNYDYPSREKIIVEHGADLASAFEAEAAKNPEQPILFVMTHYGGLVMPAALNHLCCPDGLY